MLLPIFRKVSFCDSRTAVTRESIGKPPRSRLQATRTFLKLRLSGRAKIAPGSLIDAGARRSGPAIAERRKAVSSTVRPIGPSVESVCQPFTAGQAGTRPGVGRNPTTLQKLPGLRRLAARSLPSANGSMPQATATAAPPEEPPQVFERSYGLRVAPNTALKVWLPAPNSGVLVLPRVMAPAAESRSTMT